MTPGLRQAIESAQALVAKAKSWVPDANAEDAEELRAMLADLRRPWTAGRRRDPSHPQRSRTSCSTSKTRDTQKRVSRHGFSSSPTKLIDQLTHESADRARCQSNLGMTCVARPAAPARSGPTRAGDASAICACSARPRAPTSDTAGFACGLLTPAFPTGAATCTSCQQLRPGRSRASGWPSAISALDELGRRPGREQRESSSRGTGRRTDGRAGNLTARGWP